MKEKRRREPNRTDKTTMTRLPHMARRQLELIAERDGITICAALRELAVAATHADLVDHIIESVEAQL